ncbi:MAG: GxxExxY protein [Verrucomicrobiales bacterium]|nr:GxxExxY protein [Verrucomicrobiales bacterium]
MNFEDDSYAIIGCAMHVHNALGPGLREKPYENALVIALRNKGLKATAQKPYPIQYCQQIVGDCIPDITVGESILIDAKSIDSIGDNEVAQMLNYLRISGLKVGLVINFKNAKLEWQRIVRT